MEQETAEQEFRKFKKTSKYKEQTSWTKYYRLSEIPYLEAMVLIMRNKFYIGGKC